MLQTGYAKAEEIDLKPWLLAAVIALLAADLIISLALRGLLRPRAARRRPPPRRCCWR